MTEEISLKEKRFNKLITVISIAIPLVVALLFGYKIPNAKPLSFLPPIYAGINGLTAILLIAAVVAIKNGRQLIHRRLMTTNIILSALFLVMYVIRNYHFWWRGSHNVYILFHFDDAHCAVHFCDSIGIDYVFKSISR